VREPVEDDGGGVTTADGGEAGKVSRRQRLCCLSNLWMVLWFVGSG
jgi:hypothetical protein